MKLLKDYESSSLTLERVREVIDRALDELEYDSRFDVNVAVENAYYYLAHTACWDEDLDAFQAQLHNGCGPDDGAGELNAYERVEILAAQVERLLNDKETYAYSKTIDEDALLDIVAKTHPRLLAKRPADMSVEDFKHLWTMVVSAYIVGGRDYAEDEFINYTDAIGATPEAVAAVIRAANE